MLDFDDQSTYMTLLQICSPLSVDPSASLEAEAFFRASLAEYSGTNDNEAVSSWLREQIMKHFVALKERPRWIQGYEWPFSNGEPMVFVGQLDVVASGAATELFHDDTSFYVFIGQSGPPMVLMQQY